MDGTVGFVVIVVVVDVVAATDGNMAVIKQLIFKGYHSHIFEIIRQSLRLPVVLNELVKASRDSLRQLAVLQHFQEQLL